MTWLCCEYACTCCQVAQNSIVPGDITEKTLCVPTTTSLLSPDHSTSPDKLHRVIQVPTRKWGYPGWGKLCTGQAASHSGVTCPSETSPLTASEQDRLCSGSVVCKAGASWQWLHWSSGAQRSISAQLIEGKGWRFWCHVQDPSAWLVAGFCISETPYWGKWVMIKLLKECFTVLKILNKKLKHFSQ